MKELIIFFLGMGTAVAIVFLIDYSLRFFEAKEKKKLERKWDHAQIKN